MRFFRFFRRCGVLLKVLIGICVVLALALVILCLDGDVFRLGLGGEELLRFGVVALLLVFFLTATVVLACIIADAREDLEALMRYSRSGEDSQE